MNTKIVYALTSNSSDYYYEQLLMSLYTLKHHNPVSEVSVVCDDDTFGTLVGNRTGIRQFADNIIRITAPAGLNKTQKSRYLKTNLRHFVDGDYLFIDTDTVITSKLDDIDNCKGEICGVLDYYCPYLKGKELLRGFFVNLVKKLQWDELLGMPYINSGVLFVKDCDNTRRFYNEWYKAHLEASKQGIYIDQIPFVKARLKVNVDIRLIGDEWNYQIKHRYSYPNPFIIHYIASSSKCDKCFVVEEPIVLDEIKNTGEILSSLRKALLEPETLFGNEYHTMKPNEAHILNSVTFRIYEKSKPAYLFLNIIAKGIDFILDSFWLIKKYFKSTR